MTIEILCCCGGPVKINLDRSAKPIRCPKCGTGMALVTEVKHYVWFKPDREWVEAEAYCEGCRKALLHSDIAWSDSDGVVLCADCAKEESH